MLMNAVILCGGMGKRLPLADENLPKPMVDLCGLPCLERQVLALRAEGIKHFTFLAGYKSGAIRSYFKNGEKWGVGIDYILETEPKGTAGSLFDLKFEDDFLFLNGDLVFSFELQPMLAFHRQKGALVTCFSHKSTHPQDSTLTVCDETGRILHFIRRGEENPDECILANAGIYVVSPKLLDLFSFSGAADFDRDVLRPLSGKGIYAYVSSEYVKDIGTPQRLAEAERDVRFGLPGMLRLSQRKKAVFLDRDGTLNVHDGYITEPGQLKLIDGVAEALRMFHARGYLCIVVTNQPTVARGENTEEELGRIHRHLEYLLAKRGAYIDDLYYCPHHPDKGFEGERPSYKVECDCRKPKPGMVLLAAQEHNIDISKSFLAGDSETDVLCAENAGAKPVRITTEYRLIDFAKAMEE